MGLKDRLEEDRVAEGRADRGSVTHWRRRLLEEINLEDLTRLTLAQRRVRLEKVVGHILTREGPVLSDRERSVLIRRVVDESSPMVDARLPTGERVNVIIPPLSLSGPVLTIRRFPKPYPIDELVRMGSLDSPTGILLAAMVRARFNIVVSGGTGTGKTTFLNAMSAFVPSDERIVTIEDSAELQLMQEHVVRLESRPPNIEGRGEIAIRDLVRNALRMRPDRIIVGEVRGSETIDMLQAMNTGHDGSLVTVHANSADDAIHRLQTLSTLGEGTIPYDAIRDQINNAVDAIVHLGRWPDGSRRVSEIAVVSSRRREEFRLDPVMRFEAMPMGPHRTVEGRFRHFPLPRHIAGRIYHVGEAIPAAFGVASEEQPRQGW